MAFVTFERITLGSFAVIGKMGSTEDGPGFIQSLWADANAHFHEIAHLAVLTEQGTAAGVWGAMSDLSLSFGPWEDDFTRGLYLAGAECRPDAEPPEGWTKWIIPGFEYLRAENEGEHTFQAAIGYLRENGLPLCGAVHDFTDPATGKGYMLFPIRRL